MGNGRRLIQWLNFYLNENDRSCNFSDSYQALWEFKGTALELRFWCPISLIFMPISWLSALATVHWVSCFMLFDGRWEPRPIQLTILCWFQSLNRRRATFKANVIDDNSPVLDGWLHLFRDVLSEFLLPFEQVLEGERGDCIFDESPHRFGETSFEVVDSVVH